MLTETDPSRLTPNAESPIHHRWLHQIQLSGQLAGELDRDSSDVGLPCHAPFLDQEVITACLAVSPYPLQDPQTYKPLLGAALNDLLPYAVQQRTTKDHCLPEWHAGLRAQQGVLAEWCSNLRLSDLGLVDPVRFRRVALNPELAGSELAAVEKTLATEAWLRDLENAPVPAYLRGGEQ